MDKMEPLHRYLERVPADRCLSWTWVGRNKLGHTFYTAPAEGRRLCLNGDGTMAGLVTRVVRI